MFQKLLKTTGVLAAIMMLTLGLSNVNSLELVEHDNTSGDISLSESIKNPHLFGANIDVTANVEGDIVAAGQDVSISEKVQITGSAIIAGQTLDIDASSVEHSARYAGQNIDITGNYKSDLVVFGQSINIKNAIIDGDLITFGATVKLENVTVNGKFNYGVDSLSKDNNNTFNGAVNEIANDSFETTEATYAQKVRARLLGKGWFFGVGIAVLSFITFRVLRKNNKLEIEEVSFGGGFWRHLGIGMALTVGAGLLYGIVAVLSLGTLAWWGGLFVTMMWTMLLLSFVFLPIYMGNLLHKLIPNTFVGILAIITFIVGLLIHIFAPHFIILAFVFLFGVACFGFLISKAHKTIWTAIKN